MTMAQPDYDARTNPLVTCPRCGVTKRKISPAGRVWLEDNANHCQTCVSRMRRGEESPLDRLDRGDFSQVERRIHGD